MPEEPKQACPHCNYPLGGGHAPDCPIGKERDFDLGSFLEANKDTIELSEATAGEEGRKERRLVWGGMTDPESIGASNEVIDLNEKRLNPLRAELFYHLSSLPQARFDELQRKMDDEYKRIEKIWDKDLTKWVPSAPKVEPPLILKQNPAMNSAYGKMIRIIAFRREIQERGDDAFRTRFDQKGRLFDLSSPAARIAGVTGGNFQSKIEVNQVPSSIWGEPSTPLKEYYRQKLRETETEFGIEPEDIKYTADIEQAKKCERIYYRMMEKGLNVEIIG